LLWYRLLVQRRRYRLLLLLLVLMLLLLLTKLRLVMHRRRCRSRLKSTLLLRKVCPLRLGQWLTRLHHRCLLQHCGGEGLNRVHGNGR
jgi:hypothetical protein